MNKVTKPCSEWKEAKFRPPGSVWIALGAGLLAASCWMYMHPFFMQVLGGFFVVVSMYMFISREQWATLTVVLIILMMAACVLMPCYTRIDDSGRNAGIKSEMHYIQIALEEYAGGDDNYYPLSLDQAWIDKYMPESEMPWNRYWFVNFEYDTYFERGAETKMQPLGSDFLPDDLKSKLGPLGNICYLPRIEASELGGMQATGYMLLGIGRKRWLPGWYNTGEDAPVVVLQLNSEDIPEQERN